jgi:hypothetical protein
VRTNREVRSSDFIKTSHHATLGTRAIWSRSDTSGWSKIWS